MGSDGDSDFGITPPKEIAIVGDDAQPLLDVVFEGYRPNQGAALKRGEADSVIPLLEGRAIIDNKATAYACQKFACQMPAAEANALQPQQGIVSQLNSS